MYEKYSKVLLLLVQIILIGLISTSPLIVPIILISISLMITSTKD